MKDWRWNPPWKNSVASDISQLLHLYVMIIVSIAWYGKWGVWSLKTQKKLRNIVQFALKPGIEFLWHCCFPNVFSISSVFYIKKISYSCIYLTWDQFVFSRGRFSGIFVFFFLKFFVVFWGQQQVNSVSVTHIKMVFHFFFFIFLHHSDWLPQTCGRNVCPNTELHIPLKASIITRTHQHLKNSN